MQSDTMKHAIGLDYRTQQHLHTKHSYNIANNLSNAANNSKKLNKREEQNWKH